MDELRSQSSDGKNDFELSICNSFIENMSPNVNNDAKNKSSTSYFNEAF
jgi:hypothetical protein